MSNILDNEPDYIIVNQRCCFNQNTDIHFIKQIFPKIKINNIYFTPFGIKNKSSYQEPYVVLKNNEQIPLKKYIIKLQNNLEILAQDDEQIVYDAGDRVIIENKPT